MSENNENDTELMQFGLQYWRDRIPSHYFYINEALAVQDGIDVKTAKIESIHEEYLCIKLGGLRYLAKIFGHTNVSYRIDFASPTRVGVTCTINWKNGESYSDVASATADNVRGLMSNYLEAVAANRAFARAVRNYLGISAVSDVELTQPTKSEPQIDEVPKTQEISTKELGPHKSLKKALESKGWTLKDAFEKIKVAEPTFFDLQIFEGISENTDICSLSIPATRALLAGVKKY